MADAVTAVLVQGNGELGQQRFRTLFDIKPFTFTFDIATALADAAGTGATHEVALNGTIPGLALGDLIFVAPTIDVADLGLVAHVTAVDTLTVQVKNLTGGDLTTLNASPRINAFALRVRPEVLAALMTHAA